MQNAIIKYKIRVDIGERKNDEFEISMELNEFESDYTISDALLDLYGIETDVWEDESYTVIERTIEPFNED